MNTLWSLAGMAVGAVVTWLVAERYARKATKEQEDTLKRIGALATALQLLLPAQYEIERDAKGLPTGRVIGKLSTLKL